MANKVVYIGRDIRSMQTAAEDDREHFQPACKVPSLGKSDAIDWSTFPRKLLY